MRIYVGNLPYSATEAELQELFGPYGTVDEIVFPMDRDTGRPKGFAFVEMPNGDEATKALVRHSPGMPDVFAVGAWRPAGDVEVSPVEPDGCVYARGRWRSARELAEDFDAR